MSAERQSHRMLPELASERSRIRLRTLVAIRWIAVAGQSVTLLVVHFGLGFTLPIIPALLVVAVSAALNLLIVKQRPKALWLGEREAALYLAYDLLQLAVLLLLTGGLKNPFSLLLLAPVTVSASMLSRSSTAVLAALGVISASVLAVWHLPLRGGETLLNQPIYSVGIWVAVVSAILFIAGYLGSIALEARRVSDALAATQAALAREQQLSALGGLAAAAAHELGTPLGTIAVVARELARDLPPDGPLREDAEILIAETARCREILAELAARPESDAGEPFNLLPVSVLAKAAAEPFRRPGIDLEVTCEGMQPEPRIRRSPELLHGLGTLLQNAIQFASGRVDVRIAWDAAELSVTIRDDGPGFDPRILEELGRPYLSTRRFAKKQEEWEGEVHMGLGVFIAQALLGRTGARLDFTNAPRGGAQVAIRWRRPILEGETAAAAS